MTSTQVKHMDAQTSARRDSSADHALRCDLASARLLAAAPCDMANLSCECTLWLFVIVCVELESRPMLVAIQSPSFPLFLSVGYIPAGRRLIFGPAA